MKKGGKRWREEIENKLQYFFHRILALLAQELLVDIGERRRQLMQQ
jgi:hypothetical protein